MREALDAFVARGHDGSIARTRYPAATRLP
jgi:hypothetical protein